MIQLSFVFDLKLLDPYRSKVRTTVKFLTILGWKPVFWIRIRIRCIRLIAPWIRICNSELYPGIRIRKNYSDPYYFLSKIQKKF
jgi:hypothetical protein